MGESEITNFKGHTPVLAQEVVEYLSFKFPCLYLDCTLGLGGHAQKLLEASSPHSRLIGIDVDPQAILIAGENLRIYGDRVSLINGNFADLGQILSDQGVSEVDGVIMDLGVSSIQLDTPERGFSFRHAGPLDMRMNQTEGQPVFHDLNNEDADKLVMIIHEYGEERWAKKIAASIVRNRKESLITTTTRLAEIIARTVPGYGDRIHPATRTFQALRIYKNQELDNLKKGLDQAILFLRPGGRICVISFHSLEDRIVKNTFRTMERGCVCPPKIPKCICGHKPLLKVITRRPVTPGDKEIEVNPRSRSAKLRAAEKI